MKCTIIGPSEHIKENDRTALTAGLQGLGLDVSGFPMNDTPPGDSEILIIGTRTAIDGNNLPQLGALKLIVTTTSGFDHIDIHATRKAKVPVARCPLARRDAVVETSLALGLSLLRKIPVQHADCARGEWKRAEVADFGIPLMSGLRIGVVGHGVIGNLAGRTWTALGADVRCSDPNQPELPATEELLPWADILTLHCSLTESSRRLINADSLRRMKKGAILLNTARGECVHLDALCNDNHLGGIGLDVFEPEPSPLMAEIASRENVLLTPHAAGVHRDLGKALVNEALSAVSSFLETGQVPHEVENPE